MTHAQNDCYTDKTLLKIANLNNILFRTFYSVRYIIHVYKITETFYVTTFKGINYIKMEQISFYC
jgi:hypothetical protein